MCIRSFQRSVEQAEQWKPQLIYRLNCVNRPFLGSPSQLTFLQDFCNLLYTSLACSVLHVNLTGRVHGTKWCVIVIIFIFGISLGWTATQASVFTVAIWTLLALGRITGGNSCIGRSRTATVYTIDYDARGSHIYVLCGSICKRDQNWIKRSKPFWVADHGIKVTSELLKINNQECTAAIWPLTLEN